MLEMWLAFFNALILMSACGIKLDDLEQGQTITAQWQSPANYARTPIGVNPVNPITLSVDFSNHSGCPNQTYRFWLFSADGGTPLTGVGANATPSSITNHFEQRIVFPVDIPVYQIRLSCTQPNGDRYTDSNILESGSPAFTPRVAISWKNPSNYMRTPAGIAPLNPITISANFTDENGCPYQLYRFWSYGLNGSPISAIGDATTLIQGEGISVTSSLPANVAVYAIRLACVDNTGNRYDNGPNLEIGNPAFTPQESENGTCSGQNASACETPTDSITCQTCGGTWGPANICEGNMLGDCEGTWTVDQCATWPMNNINPYAPCTWNSSASTCEGGEEFALLGYSWSCQEQAIDEASCLTAAHPVNGNSQLCIAGLDNICHAGTCNGLTEEQCNTSTAITWGCVWNSNVHCINHATDGCSTPQTQEQCVACGGVWTPT